jgi:hypothetical protein
VYDTTGAANISSGQNYRAITSVPGFDAIIRPYEGFWVILEPTATEPLIYLPLKR